MSSGWIVGLELAAVMGLVVGFGVWELVRLRRGRKGGGRSDGEGE